MRQLGSNLAKNRKIVYVAEARNQEKGAGFRLREQVFDLSPSKRGVDRDQDGADLGQSELEHDPLRSIRGPDRNSISLFNTERQQAQRCTDGLLFEPGEAPTQIPVRIDQGFVVRQPMRQLGKEIAHSTVLVGEVECHDLEDPYLTQSSG
jgi:hypothetical protein